MTPVIDWVTSLFTTSPLSVHLKGMAAWHGVSKNGVFRDGAGAGRVSREETKWGSFYSVVILEFPFL